MLKDTMVSCNYKVCGKQHGSSMGLHFDKESKNVYCDVKCYLEHYYLIHTGKYCEVIDARRDRNWLA